MQNYRCFKKKTNKYNSQALWKLKIVFVERLSEEFLFNTSNMLQLKQ